MWEIKNETPFATGSGFCLDDRTSELTWLVAVKATFDISSAGALSLSEEQVGVFSEAQYRDEEGVGSLVHESDIVPEKFKVDVLLNATAYAPEGESLTNFLVGVTLGDWSKTLKVIGDRYWEKNFGLLNTTGTSPLNQIPIIYENAYGGIDESSSDQIFPELRNPAGTGFSKKRSALNEQRLPNVEYPGFRYKRKPKRNKVAGFGAIASHWSPRLDYIGTHNKEWSQQLTAPRPLDFDPRFYQCAPEDQQLSAIETDRYVELFNLTPNGNLRFELPGVELKIKTLLDDELIPHPATLQTIIIEPDYPRVMMVWGTHLKCQNREDLLDFTKINCELDLPTNL